MPPANPGGPLFSYHGPSRPGARWRRILSSQSLASLILTTSNPRGLAEGRVPQMNKINSWKCFHEAFPLLVSASVKNTDLKVNSLGHCGEQTQAPLPIPSSDSSASSAPFRHRPRVSPGKARGARSRVVGVPQRQATGTPGAQETLALFKSIISQHTWVPCPLNSPHIYQSKSY